MRNSKHLIINRRWEDRQRRGKRVSHRQTDRWRPRCRASVVSLPHQSCHELTVLAPADTTTHRHVHYYNFVVVVWLSPTQPPTPAGWELYTTNCWRRLNIALTLLVGHQEEHPVCKNWVMGCWCGYLPKTPSPLASFKSRLVLPFWYRLTQAVLENRLLNRCSSCCCWRCWLCYHNFISPYLWQHMQRRTIYKSPK